MRFITKMRPRLQGSIYHRIVFLKRRP